MRRPKPKRRPPAYSLAHAITYLGDVVSPLAIDWGPAEPQLRPPASKKRRVALNARVAAPNRALHHSAGETASRLAVSRRVEHAARGHAALRQNTYTAPESAAALFV